MDDRREILIALGWRLLLATPLLVITAVLFATTSGDADGGGKRLLGLACAVAAGIVVAPPLAGLIAEPAGSLFFPRRRGRPEPGYSLAQAQRKRGRYEQAITEYERIAAQFPDALQPHVAMLEIAFVDLSDDVRADTIVRRGLAALHDEQGRMELLRTHRTLKARWRAAAEEKAATERTALGLNGEEEGLRR